VECRSPEVAPVASPRASATIEDPEGNAAARGSGSELLTDGDLVLTTELPTTANTFKVPFFVIQGREDMVTPTAVAIQYFNIVKAPKKKLILIDHAGHFAFVTHGEEFLAALVKYVRALAVKSERH
jgi:pimeloyl-ACP methyl ester carboxylesterase